MGTIDMFQLPCSPPQNFLPWFFFSLCPIIFFSDPNPSLSSFPPSPLCHPPPPSSHLPQAEQASLSHVVDLLPLILLTAIWAVCPRDSLALLGQWVQDKLSQVSPRMLIPSWNFLIFHSIEETFSHFTHSFHWPHSFLHVIVVPLLL